MEGTVLAKTLRGKLAKFKEQSKGQCGWETGAGDSPARCTGIQGGGRGDGLCSSQLCGSRSLNQWLPLRGSLMSVMQQLAQHPPRQFTENIEYSGNHLITKSGSQFHLRSAICRDLTWLWSTALPKGIWKSCPFKG